MKLVSEGAAKNRSVRAGGYMILMQEQDSFGKSLFQVFSICSQQLNKHIFIYSHDHYIIPLVQLCNRSLINSRCLR